jgi:hypothetical protein
MHSRGVKMTICPLFKKCRPDLVKYPNSYPVKLPRDNKTIYRLTLLFCFECYDSCGRYSKENQGDSI